MNIKKIFFRLKSILTPDIVLYIVKLHRLKKTMKEIRKELDSKNKIHDLKQLIQGTLYTLEGVLAVYNDIRINNKTANHNELMELLKDRLRIYK